MEAKVYRKTLPYLISISIQPEGFWANVVQLVKEQNINTGKWKPAEIGWGAGGRDNTLSSIKTTQCFVGALEEAMRIAAELDTLHPVGTNANASKDKDGNYTINIALAKPPKVTSVAKRKKGGK